MQRLLFVFVLLVAGVVGLSFYMGWFRISSDSSDDKSKVTFSLDKKKFQEDKNTAEEKMQNLGHQVKDKTAEQPAQSMDGTVVSISADKLTMANKEGKEHDHTLAANVKVTCDGKTCIAADLKRGMKIRVTTEKAEPHAATRIEALDNNRDFEKGA